jgi:methylated-DNA-[protein]-cysteine S-methyltransferase
MKNVFFYQTSIGKIGIAENGQAITNLYFNEERIPHDAVRRETELLQEAGRQLMSYLAGKRKAFDLPFAAEGTAFMRRVWEALRAIPYGETRSYQAIAQTIGSPAAARAVGNANNRNPLPIFIPCHRVVGSKGDLVGYLGGLDMKKQLLALEKQ